MLKKAWQVIVIWMKVTLQAWHLKAKKDHGRMRFTTPRGLSYRKSIAEAIGVYTHKMGKKPFFITHTTSHMHFGNMPRTSYLRMAIDVKKELTSGQFFLEG